MAHNADWYVPGFFGNSVIILRILGRCLVLYILFKVSYSWPRSFKALIVYTATPTAPVALLLFPALLHGDASVFGLIAPSRLWPLLSTQIFDFLVLTLGVCDMQPIQFFYGWRCFFFCRGCYAFYQAVKVCFKSGRAWKRLLTFRTVFQSFC